MSAGPLAATGSRTRARGFAAWNPRAAARGLLERVREVLMEYQDHLPLTIRQIFYRLVGNCEYDKSESAYKALGEILNRARRAGLVPFSAIRDDGVTANRAPGWASEDHLIRAFRREVDDFTLDRQQGQPRRLILICEAAGMVPQIERVAHPYSIEVLSSGGFDSTTAKHALACKAVGYESAVEILHIGDHDPSGVHVFRSLAGDVLAFAEAMGGGDVDFTRLAVTPEQVEQLSLPTAPAKLTDRRSFSGVNGDATATVQAEAIPPDKLAEIVSEAIKARLGHEAYRAVLVAESHAKAELAAWLESRP